MHVEFFGISRQRAGTARAEVQAETLGQLLRELAAEFPDLSPMIEADRLHRTFVANLNGDRFVDDPATKLAKDDSVLILSADAGG